MSTQSISTRKPATAAPIVAILELASAHEFLFAAVETLVAFTIVLPGEGFAAVTADKWTFIGMCAQV